MTKKLYIKSYGCQMNVYDSDRMADLLTPHGYALTQSPEGADLVILNTCHIREKATEKVYSDLGRLKPIRDAKNQEDENMTVVVAGCTAQAEGDQITRRTPFVDLVIGPQSYHRLPELIAKIRDKKTKESGAFPNTGAQNVVTDFPVESKFDFLPQERSSQKGTSAFVTIQEGCDKFCTFCCVPYTRGMEYSRPVQDILKETHQLLAQGVREITLLGQNVNAYHGQSPGGQEWGLGRLLFELGELEAKGLKRLRYMTSHPKDVNEELIRAHAEIPTVMPFLHLPVQSGSDGILKAMNRQHTGDFYRRIIDDFRTSQPKIAFSSDFIVGFPGETRQDFAHTLQLVNDVDYAQAFSFSYSIRPGTPAGFLEDQIDPLEKQERLHILQDLLRQQQLRFNKSKENEVMDVLFEKPGKKPNQYIGKSPYLQSVHVFHDKCLIGKSIQVKITQGYQNSLEAEIITPVD